MNFRPSKPTHACGKDPNTDMLTSAPTGVEDWDFDLGHSEFGDGCKVSISVASLDETENSVETICADCNQDIGNGAG